jgi:hypothetical protein
LDDGLTRPSACDDDDEAVDDDELETPPRLPDAGPTAEGIPVTSAVALTIRPVL